MYPIKVNQNRTVVEEIIEFGRPFHYGLEAGSKPELLAIMAIHQDDESLIICNGYKDEEYIETALLASKMGKTVILVVEKPTELDNIHRVSERVKIKPPLGIRARLSSRGAGRWEQSGGDFSKFGLSAAEMVEAVEQAQGVGRGRHAQAPPLPPRLADLARSRASRTRCARPAACSSSCTSSARRACRTSTSAAVSASTTTARRRTSRRR